MKYIVVMVLALAMPCASYAMDNQLDIIEELEQIKEDLLMTPLFSSIGALDSAIKALRQATPGQERTYMRKAQTRLRDAAAELAQHANQRFPVERDAVQRVRAIHRQVQQWNRRRAERPRSPQHPLRESYSPSLEDQKENQGYQ